MSISHGPQQLMSALMWPNVLIAWLRPVRNYHVKHAQGVSTQYNQHSEQDPWYGAGQGARDACACWIVQANSMISVYHTHTNSWQIMCPDYRNPLQLGLDAFIDDTDLMTATTLPNCRLHQSRWPNTIWHYGTTFCKQVEEHWICPNVSGSTSIGNRMLKALSKLWHLQCHLVNRNQYHLQSVSSHPIITTAWSSSLPWGTIHHQW